MYKLCIITSRCVASFHLQRVASVIRDKLFNNQLSEN